MEVKVVTFETPDERVRGLQFREAIEPDTLFVFPSTYQGAAFHSKNVPESFDIAFLSRELIVIQIEQIWPPGGISVAPPGTSMAVEAKAGMLKRWGFRPGYEAFEYAEWRSHR